MKLCIFSDKNECSNCGECDLCELNRNKKCDNCGKCLQLEGYDVKAIKIDEVFEDPTEKSGVDTKISIEDFSDFEDELEFEELSDEAQYEEEADEEYIDALDDDNNWQYIEDIENVRDLLEDVNSLSELGYEKYPGLIVINNE